jgi:hypothetical protein
MRERTSVAGVSCFRDIRDVSDQETGYDLEALHGRHRESSAKLDYYLVGLAVAALAYGISSAAKPMAASVLTITISSWTMLAVSAACGVLRIKQGVIRLALIDVKVAMHRNVVLEAGKRMKSLQPGETITELETGESISVEAAQQRQAAARQAVKELVKEFARVAKQAQFLQLLRDGSLLVGLVCAGIAKAMQLGS